jgi:proteic killer suppression protein
MSRPQRAVAEPCGRRTTRTLPVASDVLRRPLLGGRKPLRPPGERPALRKLKQLELARRIEDLRAPPANPLEQLKGGRAGQWSLRVNDQFRICFRWTGSDAEDVEIVDYHRGKTR